MNREAGGGVLLLVGLVVARLAFTGRHTSYVRPGLGLLLLIAAGILVLVGPATLLMAARSSAHEHGTTRVGWFLLIPMLALVAVEPAPLGAYAARLNSGRTPVTRPTADFAPMAKPVDGAVTLQMNEFVGRALFDDEQSLEDQPVRLTGFALPAESGGGFELARFVIGCCAADARPVTVRIHGISPRPKPDTWLEVVGIWRPAPPAESVLDPRVPELDATSSKQIPEPDAPYEI